MEEKNELNDIILNKGGATAGNKKVVLAVATLGVILIVVVMLMNTLTSNGTDNLPQAVLPPEPQKKQTKAMEEEPLFEEVKVVQDADQNSDSLDKIAKKLKEESQKENTSVIEKDIITKEITKPKTIIKERKKITAKKVPEAKTASSQNYYIQVGSFSKYKPNKKFLDSITNKGFKYKFHEVTRNSKTLNKVLVGPFASEQEAREALRTIRSSIEAGAFLTKI
ncbi:SPOR domain-containing protein [Candidatus Sulfurimonas marisnigri]|uniref:SPOR domain-containing protein n=1 Tax=Candidatus Sulfurimonas marisnigri TaxID=2740405 RepID=A0A7S7LZQ3_9BACT|nr:SPOR domain-containing protein [Candidatus Sulfurimonas marisnigri]QOY53868.1 SPOR domain-containing protein [Candidatus Sulfurimonas marisnigri]